MSRLFCSLLFCVCIWGQQTNTLFRTLTVTKNSPVAGEAITNSAPNIGQVYHQFNVTASGSGCVAKYFRSVVEGSFDNSVWSATNTFLTNIQFPSGTTAVRSYAAIGLYPYLRIHLYPYPVATCNFSVQYAGGLGPPTIDIANTFVVNSTTLSASGNIWNTADPYQSNYVVYGLNICSMTGAAQTVAFDNGTVTLATYSIPANDCLVISADIYPLFTVNYGSTVFHATLSSATLTSFDIIYRME